MARTVNAAQPKTKFRGLTKDFSVEEKKPDEKSLDLEPELFIQLNEGTDDTAEKKASAFKDEAIDDASILEDFALMSKGGSKKKTPQKKTPTLDNTIFDKKDVPTQSDDPWEDYLQHINLEIMRTRDYHSSVLKGDAIKNFYVTGADKFWEEMRTTTRSALGIDMVALEQKTATENISPTFHAICLGTGTR
jgi:hypothetical protein